MCAGDKGHEAFVVEGGPEVLRMAATVWVQDPDITAAVEAVLTNGGKAALGPRGSMEPHLRGCGCVVQ